MPLRLFQLGTRVPAVAEPRPGPAPDRPVPAGRPQARARRPRAPARAEPGSRGDRHGARRRGKTRLATAAAQELVESYDDGVTFVDLAPIRDPEVVLPRSRTPSGSRATSRPRSGPGSTCWCSTTSSRSSSSSGHRPAPGCGARRRRACDEPRADADPGRARVPDPPAPEAPAVELFRQRAQAARYDFEADYRQLAAICERLDNLPLAIELAAARMKVLRPTSSSSGSTAGSPSWPPRIAACRLDSRRCARRSSGATGSSPPRRLLFDRLAVFRGRWTVDAAEAVCDADLDTLTSLVDKNLVREDGERFRMLETVREYARERLDLRGESADLRRRHAEFYARLGKLPSRISAGPAASGSTAWRPSSTTSVGARLEPRDRRRARLSDRRVPALLLAPAGARGRGAPLGRAGARSARPPPSDGSGPGLHVLGALLFWEGEFERSARALEESLALYRGRRPTSDRGDRQHARQLDLGPRRPQADSKVARGGDQALLGAPGPARRRADALHRGESRDTGDRAGARRAFEESLDVMRELGDKSFVMASLHGLGDLELDSRTSPRPRSATARAWRWRWSSTRRTSSS